MRLTIADAVHSLERHATGFPEPCHDATFLQLFRHGSLEVEICRPHQRDLQQPHEKDELYIIASGEGILDHAGERQPARPGDLFFVPAGDEHRFVDFSDDFATWVVFYGPKGGE